MHKRSSWHSFIGLIGIVCAVSPLLPGRSLAESSAARFTVVMNGAAVKDNQTGLIWEQEPDRNMTFGAAPTNAARPRKSAGKKAGAGRRSTS